MVSRKKSAPRLLINISRSLRCAGWPVRGEVRARCVWATSLGVDYRIQTKETRNKARNVSQASIDYTSIACCLFALESLIKEKRSRARASCEKRKAGEKEESAKIRLHQVKSAKHLFVLCPYNASKCNYNRLALIPIACSLITPPNVCRKTLKTFRLFAFLFSLRRKKYGNLPRISTMMISTPFCIKREREKVKFRVQFPRLWRGQEEELDYHSIVRPGRVFGKVVISSNSLVWRGKP
jgi:hypothetical protein